MGKASSDNYIEVKAPGDITIYPLVCLHLGASQCDYKFLREHVERIAADPKGRWVYMGDAGECTTKNSVGAVYEQLLSPHEQIEAVVDLLHPIRGKGLFGIRGNHGHRIFKEVGVSFDSLLCSRLGIPYLGTAAWAWIQAGGGASYATYWHHGRDSGTALKAKIQSATGFADFIDADAIFTAHSHVAMRLTPAALQSIAPQAAKIITKMRSQYICGAAYDSRSGYAQEKGYSPLLPAYIAVTFAGNKNRGTAVKRQTFQVFESNGSYDLDHSYTDKYRGKLLV